MKTLNLAPANWIWLPAERTLPNTFALFRREFDLESLPARALGWILADSRYRLSVNGARVQWGPAPADPRYPEADPFDIAPFLRVGKNVLGVEVCYFGGGDGTWALGAPGLIFSLEMSPENGAAMSLVSDENWECFLDRAHRPGQHKRWFLRALQEEFDARLHPFGWDTPDFAPDPRWMKAKRLRAAATSPPIFAGGPEKLLPCDRDDNPRFSREIGVYAREIPLMRETFVGAKCLRQSGTVRWKRDPRDWFESRLENSFEIACDEAVQSGENGVEIPVLALDEGAFLTWEFAEQIVGWPRFSVEASEGTVIEMLVQEAHDAQNGPLWLDSGHFSWSRFVCREGKNEFEAFDFESLRWLQLHVRGHARPVTISGVGVRRRLYDWPHAPQIRTSDAALQRLIDASLNTLHNSCQETCVDGMGRERQQYSGDVGHQLRATRAAFGETRQAARFLRTWSDGLTLDGYFLDCWPGFDRLARLMQRQVGATQWGPLLDHGVGFAFDCWQHFLETGHADEVRLPLARLERFFEYLETLRGAEGLLPVENLGVPTIWIDHDAYTHQKQKRCAWNLYVAGALQHALAPLCDALGNPQQAEVFRSRASQILEAAQREFWCEKRRIWLLNLPELRRGEDDTARMCARSLAQAILFDFCPHADTGASLEALATCPPELGLSYPANALWRHEALCQNGRADVILAELREKWATMPSVLQNNALSEFFEPQPDSTAQWSHCPLAPILVLQSEIAGMRALSPGFERVQIRPQLGDLPDLDLVFHTPRGPLHFMAKRRENGHDLTLQLPPDCTATLVLRDGTTEQISNSNASVFRFV